MDIITDMDGNLVELGFMERGGDTRFSVSVWNPETEGIVLRGYDIVGQDTGAGQDLVVDQNLMIRLDPESEDFDQLLRFFTEVTKELKKIRKNINSTITRSSTR